MAEYPKTEKRRKSWNDGLKGYRNPKNSLNLLSKSSNRVFSDSLRPPFESCGVYAIINKTNLKIYIGSSGHLGMRLNRWRFLAKNKETPLGKLMNSSPDDFEFSMIEYCGSRDEALDREEFWIKFYNATKPEIGYNNAKSSRCCLGVIHTEETRRTRRRTSTEMWQKRRGA